MSFLNSENLIEIQNLEFSYSSKKILQNINLSVKKGEILGFLGPNGSGKTTLMKLILGIINPEEGGILFNAEIKKGFIFQTTEQNLLPWKNALDNILLPFYKHPNNEKKIASDKAQKLILELNLSGINIKYPYQLSGGQKQLISLIRYFIAEYGLLIIDEGWSMLDVEQRENIHRIIKKLNIENSTTIIIVSHNLRDLAYLCDRVYLMSSSPGKIVESVVLNKNEMVSTRNELLWQKTLNIFPNIIRD